MGQRIRANAQGLEHSRRSRPLFWGLLALLIVAIVAVGWWVWRSPEDAKRELQNLQTNAQALISGSQTTNGATEDDQLNASELAAKDPTTPEQGPDNALPLEAEEPLNPIEAPIELASSPLPTLENSDSSISNALSAWGVTQQARSMIRNEQFVRRFVATVDNLTSARAPSAMWPVFPTDPRFTVQEGEGGTETRIAQDNSARYNLAVQFMENLNVDQAAKDYKHFYPLFQQAYEDLGYPNRYFNDRLIAVIDHLLLAPEPLNPHVNLMPVRGQIPSEQPWVRYQFEDPQLEALSAGQKILVRMGPDNARKVKSKLRELRSAIASTAAPAQTTLQRGEVVSGTR
ncbi:DUF3014 domain-containing protein [Lampropedia aestuarii]|uniref:DUF3014 domain-containing protein n=1 Tax=Lampropedia aestuarii TaxID=2562762 RepID=UPI002468D287|nr:DUF3014 domain-containing protein [Lampropedia aestuarii]MDH5857257.1 DUF3014 domain-containing protein [Lampropedia aestuarii]